MSLHCIVPGLWTVQRGHRLLESIEADILPALPSVTVFTHLESLNDPTSWDDMSLDRREPPPIGAPAEPQQRLADGDVQLPKNEKL